MNKTQEQAKKEKAEQEATAQKAKNKKNWKKLQWYWTGPQIQTTQAFMWHRKKGILKKPDWM